MHPQVILWCMMIHGGLRKELEYWNPCLGSGTMRSPMYQTTLLGCEYVFVFRITSFTFQPQSKRKLFLFGFFMSNISQANVKPVMKISQNLHTNIYIYTHPGLDSRQGQLGNFRNDPFAYTSIKRVHSDFR